jgi:hypothetical protein
MAMEMNITINPSDMPSMAILTIGLEKLVLLRERMREAINNSMFNEDIYLICKGIRKISEK